MIVKEKDPPDIPRTVGEGQDSQTPWRKVRGTTIACNGFYRHFVQKHNEFLYSNSIRLREV
jgi:hypothetical protein